MRGSRLANPEAVHQLLFDRNPQPVWILELGTMRFLEANPAAEALYGYSVDELRERTILEDLSDADRAKLLAKRDGLSSGPTLGVWRIRRKDGSYRWIEVRTQEIAEVTPPQRLVVGRDVTEERATAEALRHSLDRFDRIRESGALGILVSQVDGRIVEANDSFLRLLGYTVDDLGAGRLSWWELTPPEWREQSQEALRELQATGRSVPQEKEYLHHDGQRVPVMITSVALAWDPEQPKRFLTLVIDLTGQRAAEQARRRTETFFRAIVESSPDAVSLLAEDTTILYMSPANARISGIPTEQMIGRKLIDLPILSDKETYLKEWAQCLAQPGVPLHAPVPMRRGDGPRYLESIRVNLLHDPHLRGVVTLIRDLTDQRQLEEQLRQAQKMEAVGNLAGGVAHDFNNLLTVILSYSRDLAESLPPGARARDDAEEIYRAGERAATLTHQLLAFSRRQVLAPRVIDLRETVIEVERLVRRLVGEHIELVTQLPRQPETVRADPSQIAQVLMNLVVNARDAMPQGGRLVLGVERTHLGKVEAALHPGAEPGEYVRLWVQDTGVGMPPEVQVHIFEPFFTTKGERGTGLGLATVFGIVRQSQGFLVVDSVVGRGTTFSVYLPAVDGLLAVSALGAAPGVKRGSETLLLCEDEQQVLKLLQEILERGGYRVLACATPEEALRASEREPGEIALLLTDLVLPRMTGRQLGEQITATRPGISVLYMSGYTEDAEVQRQVDAGSVQFLAKPLTPDAVLRRVRSLLDARRASAEPH